MADANNAEFVDVWDHATDTQKSEAKEFWQRHGILPEGVDGDVRANELNAFAYHDGQLVAVSTARISLWEPLRRKFLFGRVAVDPAHRRSGLLTLIGTEGFKANQNWAKGNPDQEVCGVITILQSSIYSSGPFPPVSRVGSVYLDRMADESRVQVKWFSHIRV